MNQITLRIKGFYILEVEKMKKMAKNDQLAKTDQLGHKNE